MTIDGTSATPAQDRDPGGFVRQRLHGAGIGVGIADRAEGLATIRKPGCAAVIWRRQLAPGFQTWIDQLDPSDLPSARLMLRPGDVRAAVRQICDHAGLDTGSERAWLEADIADLAHRFADLMRAPHLRLRLDVVASNACCKFHIDALTARLICTYRGSGTQYGISTDGAEPRRSYQVARGAPIILRGTLWPEDPPSGLLHRSPPIEGTGETRLVLVLDPLFDGEDAG